MLLFTSRLNHARKLVSKPCFTKIFIAVSHASASLPDLKPLNTKISALMRQGHVDNARTLFDETPHRNSVTYNAMIRGYFLNGRRNDAVKLFDEMPQPNMFSNNTVIAGLMRCADVAAAERVFDTMGKEKDVVSWNSMISGYFCNGMVNEAVFAFEAMLERDVVSWNTVIGGLVWSGDCDLAGGYFREMPVRDAASWTIMVSGLFSLGRVGEARSVFEEMPLKDRDDRAWSALIIGYIENGYNYIAESFVHKIPNPGPDSWSQLTNGMLKSGRVNDAFRLFVETPEKLRKTWNAIVLEFVRKQRVREAHAFVAKSNHSDVVSWTNVLVGYFETGNVDRAVDLFELMPIRDATVYNVTIFGLGENDRRETGAELFVKMKRSAISPDEATFTSVLTICSDLPALKLGEQTHSLVIKSGFENFIAVCNAIITMYARCGSIDSASSAFSLMANRDIISWNSIISGFAHHGHGEKTLDMFEKMGSEKVKPNNITFVGVLSACSHAGLVDLGQHFFHVMKHVYSLKPTIEHYTCLVDLLGRFGLIDEAASLVDQLMEDGTVIPTSVWGALLGACRIHNNIEVAEIAGEMILETEPENSGVYMILAEMYLSRGRRNEAKTIWTRMKDSGVKKQPGCSWVELKNGSHVFLSGDRSNSEFGQICFVLELIQMEIIGTKNSKTM